ncbi:hypothetical protein Ato02nite_096620 [Paractinoplanes toevensis]|uniref:Uncharacterized protein n=1 Tax=Paractinoplanes toevensis TaxID=571911 RepID=A0A919WCS5_9ACTN|nr:hypothetical protein Ato02nite_096620 [Actinoplanes toevensis]
MGDVADQQVHAAGVAQGLDLAEQVEIADGGVLLTASAQVFAVGVDQREPVLRGALQSFGFAGSGAAFDRVQRHVEPAGAFEQADVLLEQGVDLLPTLPGALSARPVLHTAGLGPAHAVRGDLFTGGFDQAVPQVPPERPAAAGRRADQSTHPDHHLHPPGVDG